MDTRITDFVKEVNSTPIGVESISLIEAIAECDNDDIVWFIQQLTIRLFDHAFVKCDEDIIHHAFNSWLKDLIK